MKVKITFILALAVMLVLAAGSVWAQDTKVKVVPATQNVLPGAAFQVDVRVEDVINMKADQAVVNFDASAMQATGITEGAFLKSGGSTLGVPGWDNTGGRAWFGYTLYGTCTPVSGDGILATISFTADPAAAGTFALTLTDVVLIDGDNVEIPCTSEDGTVTISRPTEVWVDDDYTAATPGWGYDHFDNIQDGIDAVSGSTVNVEDGNYAGFTANKAGITVQASSTPVINGTGITADNQLVGILVSADNVTIDGFTVNGEYSTGISIYDATTPPSGTTIKNCTVDFTAFDPTGKGPLVWNGGCIQAKAGSGTQTRIESNTVSFNEVQANPGGYNGINIFGTDGGTYLIDENTVNMSSTVADKYHVGINMHDCDGVTPTGITISNNNVNMVTKTAGFWKFFGIWLYGGDAGAGAGPEDAKNMTLTNNTVDECCYGIRMTGPYVDALTGSGNTFPDCSLDIVVEPDVSGNAGDAIQQAVNIASSGHTITACTGTYDGFEVSKANITVQNSGSPVINGTPGKSSGWNAMVYITADGVTIDGFEVDGTGKANLFGIYVFNADDCVIKNNTVHDIYCENDQRYGVGIMAFGWGEVVDGTTIDNNTVYNTSRMGIIICAMDASTYDWLLCSDHTISNNTVHDAWYGGTNLDHGGGIQFNVGKNISITGNEIYNTGGTNFGIYAFGSASGNVISNNEIHDNPTGIKIWPDGRNPDGTYGDGIAWGGETATSPRIKFNSIINNTSYGAVCYCHASFGGLNAKDNWWRDNLGPLDTNAEAGGDHNPGGVPNKAGGTTDAVSDKVTYRPWIGGDPTTSTMLALDCDSYIKPGVNETVDLLFNGNNLQGFSVKVTFDADAVNFVSVTAGAALGDKGTVNAIDTDNTGGGTDPDGYVKLDGAVIKTGGGTFSGFGVLATLTFHGEAQGEADIATTDEDFRDDNNAQISITLDVDEEITVDNTNPTMETIDEAEDQYYNTAPTFANFGFDDNMNLDKAEFSLDGGTSWNTIFSGAMTIAWDNDNWALPNANWTDLVAEVYVTITFKVTDDAGNNSSTDWKFYKDVEAPVAVIGVSATPAASVDLSWTAVPTGDYEFEHLEIRRNGWGSPDYPTYPDPPGAPSYPGYAEGTKVLTTTVGTTDSYKDPVVGTEIATRNIYYYQIFVWDKAGNVSQADASAQARATNYLLGDIDKDTPVAPILYDNTVNYDDLSPWSTAYGSTLPVAGHPEYAEYDIGPTADGSRLGIPQPWATQNHLTPPSTIPANTIQFEDLMIFAMNYWKTLTKSMPPLVSPRADQLALVLDGKLSQQQSENWVDVTIRLDNNGQNVKGAHLVLAYDVSCLELKEVISGRVFAQQEQQEFFHYADKDGKVDISAAILGTSLGISNSGDIARLRFKMLEEEGGEISFSEVSLRDVENKALEPLKKGLSINSILPPTSYDLAQNYPNPFNPETTIKYQLPDAGNVKLLIFNSVGQVVTTLVDAEKGVGRYQVVWNGSNDSGEQVASGLYYYRIEVGDFSKLMKMVFLK